MLNNTPELATAAKAFKFIDTRGRRAQVDSPVSHMVISIARSSAKSAERPE